MRWNASGRGPAWMMFATLGACVLAAAAFPAAAGATGESQATQVVAAVTNADDDTETLDLSDSYTAMSDDSKD